MVDVVNWKIGKQLYLLNMYTMKRLDQQGRLRIEAGCLPRESTKRRERDEMP